MNPCTFCEIVARRSSANIVVEYESTLAFVPRSPVVDGHTLLIPREHYETIFDINPDVLRQLSTDAQALAHVIVRDHQATGVNLLHASGHDAQQSVNHFHFHLIPRRPNDGLGLWIKQGL